MRRRLVQIGIVVVLATAAAVIAARHLARHAFTRPYSEAELRQRWESDGTLERLADWARARLSDGGTATFDPNDFPRTGSHPEVAYPYPILDEPGRIIAIAFELGGADTHHGIVVGARPTDRQWFPVRGQWRADVWWYDEVPSMDPANRR